MYLLLLLVLCFSMSFSDPCGSCDCSVRVVTCIGGNISEIVSINNQSWPKHIDIWNTNITSLSRLYTWGELKSVNISYNSQLECTDVWELEREMPNILLATDCQDLQSSNSLNEIIPVDNPELFLFNLLLLINPSLFVVALLSYLKRRLKQNNCTNINGEVQI